MEEIRSFVAIELPDDIKSKLGKLIAQLKARNSGVKWVDANNIHLTLNFLGNVASDKIDEVTKAMEESAREIPPFQIEVKELGAFPNLRRVQVVWVGMQDELEPLGKLKQNLDFNLELIGFTPESRPFSPHLTLGRVRNEASFEERQKLGELISNTQFEGGSFKVEAVSLMKSQLTRQGSIYTRMSLTKLINPKY
ncbi:MAG: RNA 2',3'-cyclic phosphodiesterase [Chloroflexota bacterium]